MTRKNIFIILGLLMFAAFLGMMANWHFQELIKNLNRSSSELKEFTAPPFERIKEELKSISPLSSGDSSENNYQEFVSADKKLRMEYPANWIAMEEKPQDLVPKDWQETYNLKTIFLAQHFGENGLAQIIVYQGNFPCSIEEIIEKIRDANRQQGQEIEVVNSKIEEKEGTFEAIYIISEDYSLHSKEKILKESGENTYLVVFAAFDKNWGDFVEEADFVINSARILGEGLQKP